MNIPITKELLFEYFNGNASALQKQFINEWTKQPENEEFFYKCLVDWELTHPQYLVDTSSAIARYHDYLASQTNEKPVLTAVPATQSTFRTQLSGWWYIAASISILLLTSWWFRADILNRTYATQPGQIRSWTLDDGSRVTLNANSSLKVPRFGLKWAIPGQKNREVFLVGEAQFSVTHTQDNRRFIVKTPNGLDVVVLGTEFTVYSRPNRMQVVLNQGKVVLQETNHNRAPIELKPGDVVTLVDEKIQRKHVTNPERFSAWKDELFVFEATPLSQVAQLLRDNYGLHVAIPDPALARETVSGSFKATNADELLSSLSKALDIQAVRRGKKVTFSARTSD